MLGKMTREELDYKVQVNKEKREERNSLKRKAKKRSYYIHHRGIPPFM